MSDLAGKVALVTGATSGIGAASGAFIWCLDLDVGVDASREGIAARGGRPSMAA
jgi:NADP-dependent 3-hydroxy acid dehydrogenase YdfG